MENGAVVGRGFCPQCGHEHPAGANFCLNCGHALNKELAAARSDAAPAPSASGEGETNWAAIVAAVLAFWGLLRVSRKARGWAVLFVLFMVFFGCPMACGLTMGLLDQIAGLFR